VKRDRFVRLDWSCKQCRLLGNVKVYQRKDETKDDTARRHSKETRTVCIQGCVYLAERPEASL
jgi:hypothetical protein